MTSDGILLPAKTKFVFNELIFPHEIKYNGLMVNRIKYPYGYGKSERLILSRPQKVEEWLCGTNADVHIDFTKKKGSQLTGCYLAETIEIEGITFPDKLHVSKNTRNDTATWIFSVSDSKILVNGLLFSSLYVTVSLDRKKIIDFEGFLAENSIINNIRYTPGKTINKEIMKKYIISKSN